MFLTQGSKVSAVADFSLMLGTAGNLQMKSQMHTKSQNKNKLKKFELLDIKRSKNPNKLILPETSFDRQIITEQKNIDSMHILQLLPEHRNLDFSKISLSEIQDSIFDLMYKKIIQTNYDLLIIERKVAKGKPRFFTKSYNIAVEELQLFKEHLRSLLDKYIHSFAYLKFYSDQNYYLNEYQKIKLSLVDIMNLSNFEFLNDILSTYNFNSNEFNLEFKNYTLEVPTNKYIVLDFGEPIIKAPIFSDDVFRHTSLGLSSQHNNQTILVLRSHQQFQTTDFIVHTINSIIHFELIAKKDASFYHQLGDVNNLKKETEVIMAKNKQTTFALSSSLNQTLIADSRYLSVDLTTNDSLRSNKVFVLRPRSKLQINKFKPYSTQILAPTTEGLYVFNLKIFSENHNYQRLVKL